MKVLFINTNCGTGSTGRIVTDLYSLLQRKGHIAKIAYAHGIATRVDSEDVYKIQGKIGYYIHNAISRITDRAGFYSSYSTYKLIHYIEDFKPDIIHLHNIHGYYLNVGILFNYLSKINIPIVWTLHDCWAFTGHCSHFSFEGCNLWKVECHDCPLKKSYPKSYFADQSRRNYRDKKRLFTSINNLNIVTPSKWLASVTKESFLGVYPVTYIYNGIDLNIFKKTSSNIKAELGISSNKKVLLCVSFVWNKKKGLNDILLLNNLIDHNNYQIIIVGLTSKQIENLPKDIISIERTSSISKLVELYSAADVFINPSYEETMGLVTAESLACGTPAIVYDKTAVPEVVSSDSGIVVSASKVNDIYNNLEKAMQISQTNCINRAAMFEKEMQYNKYIDLYDNLLNDGNNI